MLTDCGKRREAIGVPSHDKPQNPAVADG